MKQLSDRVMRVKPSPTLAITARAKALRAAGKDIIGLGAGEPDFDTPAFIKEAAIQAIKDGFTKYTAVDGIPSLKSAIAEKFQRENQLQYGDTQILVSCGGKQVFYNLAQALLNAGDEVIIPAPYWVSYPDMVLLADATPVIVEAGIDQGFKITAEQLEAAITPKTRLFVINSPSNPTGAMYSTAELQQLGEVLSRHPRIMVISDDIYEHIRYTDSPFVNMVNACPELYDRSVVLNGVSKAYSMTGWRIGYAAGPDWLIKAMKKIQSQSTSNPTSISQVAAEAALRGDQSCIAEMLKAFKDRHDFVLASMSAINGVRCLPADGAFYSFPDFSAVIDTMASKGVKSDVEFAEFLINEAEIAIVPGSAFGAPNYIRLSYATSMENLEKALERLANALKDL